MQHWAASMRNVIDNKWHWLEAGKHAWYVWVRRTLTLLGLGLFIKYDFKYNSGALQVHPQGILTWDILLVNLWHTQIILRQKYIFLFIDITSVSQWVINEFYMSLASYMNLPSLLLHRGCMGTRLVSQFYHSNSSECCNYPLLQPCPTPGLQFTGWVSPLISCSWVAAITIMQIFLSRYPGSNILSSLNSLWTSLGIFMKQHKPSIWFIQ